MIKNPIFNGNNAKFQFNGSEEDANKFRRILMSEIPVLAGDKLEIYHNISCMNYEEIALRLFMCPIIRKNQDVNMLKIIREWKELKSIYMDIEYDWDIDNQNLMSHDIKSHGNEDLLVYPDIIIVPCGPNNCIELRMWLKVGYGKDHAKWNTVSGISFEKIKNKIMFTVTSLGQYTIQELLAEAEKIYKKMKSREKQEKQEDADDSWLDDPSDVYDENDEKN